MTPVSTLFFKKRENKLTPTSLRDVLLIDPAVILNDAIPVPRFLEHASANPAPHRELRVVAVSLNDGAIVTRALAAWDDGLSEAAEGGGVDVNVGVRGTLGEAAGFEGGCDWGGAREGRGEESRDEEGDGGDGNHY